MKPARTSITILTAGLLLANHLVAQTDLEEIGSDVRYLSADARMGRGVGTVGLDSAAAYVARRFEEAGLQPAGTDGFFQPFLIDQTAPAAGHSGLGGAAVKNVIGILPGRGNLARESVVIGAHYDHLGLGGFGSLDADSTGVVHNGADDNASGTAALIASASLLSSRQAPNVRTIVFVAFTGEELGLIGSSYYVKHPARPISSTYAMINFDMVGRLTDNTMLAIGTGSASELPGLLDSLSAVHGIAIRSLSDPWGRSDHSSFYGASIPVVHFFTDTHADYHRTTDDWDKINNRGIAEITEYTGSLAWSLALRRDKLTFLNVPPPVQSAGGGYGAYLGTIPDMTESPGGVRLTGVRGGSPADVAGIRGGDILIRLGEYEIADLYDMTAALRAHKPSDVVTVIVMRNGQRLSFTATLEKRGG